jgi:glycosyltransferase involved in cell wall biosynthesis/GT2 family glycosyltransferase
MLISVVMPVHNNRVTIDRAVGSLLRQTHPHWELLVVDDGSTDGSYERLMDLGREHGRIRASRNGENRGPAATRNEAIRNAEGSVIAYLDADDEFYDDYLWNVNHFAPRGDVQVYGYDVIDDDHPERPARAWDQGRFKSILFGGNLAAPLGIAHRRDLALQVGGFNEELWALEDWDLWRLMARTGAEFLFVPLRSGRYHIRDTSRSRMPRLTENQRRVFAARLSDGRSLYRDDCGQGLPIEKLLLLTAPFPFIGTGRTLPHSAATARLATNAGFACQAYCLSKTPLDVDINLEVALSDAGLPFQAQDTVLGPHRSRMIYTRVGNVPVSIYRTRSSRPAEYDEGELVSVLDYYERFLVNFRPDAVLACNPGPKPDLTFDFMLHVGKGFDIPLVLWLGDESAINVTVLQNVDHCVVTSEYLRRLFWDRLGLVCQKLPLVFDWESIHVQRHEPRDVTILATSSSGDRLVAAKIAEKVARLRPDISVVVSPEHAQPEEGSTTRERENPHVQYRLPERLRTTRVLVVPSLGHYGFDRATAEAMINGIPVVVSNRGALPEIVGDAALVIDIPSCYQSESPQVPRADDVASWVEAIVRLWDDSQFYEKISRRSVSHAQQWHPDRVTPVYVEFLRKLRVQPGPPLIPRWSDKSEFPYYPSPDARGPESGT